MPLIEPEDKQPDQKIDLKLRPEIALELRAYAQFAESSLSHVVSAALKRLFAADKEFKEWQKKHPNAEANQQASLPVANAKGKAAAQ